MYVDSKIPKIEDVEKVMSSDFNGWVDHGGHWKPTKCKARKKVMSSISSVQLKSSLDSFNSQDFHSGYTMHHISFVL